MRETPGLGVGLGYRAQLRDDILLHQTDIDFLEIVADQFLFVPSDKLDPVRRLADDFPLVAHCVGLSLGSDTSPNEPYLVRLRYLLEQLSFPWFSDHFALTRTRDADIEQLASLWFTDESLEAVIRNVRHLKAVTPGLFLLENISHYFSFPGADMSEAEFITQTLEQTDSGLLLDVNNVYVNSINLKQDPYKFLDALPMERVVQIHIAGGTRRGDIIVDTHSTPVSEPVWDLLDYVIARSPARSILLEWDADFPPFDVLLSHLARARAVLKRHQLQ